MKCPIPDHAEIRFAVTIRTGKIHILRHVPEHWEGDSKPGETVGFAAGLAAMAATPAGMLCPVRLQIAMAGSGTSAPRGDYTGRPFDDTDLCIACVRAMGEGVRPGV